MNTINHTTSRTPPFILFGTVALPAGWVLLSIPLVVDVPLAPFILATLYFGLVAPALLLTRHDPERP